LSEDRRRQAGGRQHGQRNRQSDSRHPHCFPSQCRIP
jgi:hypothetical protein